MEFNITKAAEIVGIVRQTMYRHIKSHGISTHRNENGELMIDQSELIRVYGDDCIASGLKRQQDGAKTVASRQSATARKSVASDSVEHVRLAAELEKFKAIAARADEELSYVKELLETEKTERRQATKLLEDLRTKGSRAEELESALKSMESRLDGYEEERRKLRERIARARRTRLEKEREAINNRPWYQRIFA